MSETIATIQSIYQLVIYCIYLRLGINRIGNTAASPAQTSPHHQVSQPHSSTALLPPSFPTRPGSRIPVIWRPDGSLMSHSHCWIGKKTTTPATSFKFNRGRCPFDMLPDEVLLSIFDFCVNGNGRTQETTEVWQTLVHVCRQWRTVVFASPRRLNLQLLCSDKTLARDTFDVWPAFPLLVQCHGLISRVDNIVAVLKRSNRVCQIDLRQVRSWDLRKVLAAMKEPFPELTHLQFRSFGTVAALPDSFLGGSAPSLRFLSMKSVSFPGLPKLLLSATHLVDLQLYDIPHSGYFSPEAMLIALSTLTSLETLLLEFQSPLSLPDPESRRPPPPTRFFLPVLMRFRFKGASEYLDDLVARIDAPRLDRLNIVFFNQNVFEIPQLIQFISRTPRLMIALEKACVIFENRFAAAARINLSPRTSHHHQALNVRILCRELNWQVSSLHQVCISCLPLLSTLEDLHIHEERWWESNRQNNLENTQWLELLQPFTAVKNLYLSEEFARHIAPALQELVGDRTTEVLPTLQNIFLEGFQEWRRASVQEGIWQFVAARQTSHPIAVSRWDTSGAGSR